MLPRKVDRKTAEANQADRKPKQGRRVPLSPSDLKFISENQKLAGFSGKITEETATYEADMDVIAESAASLGAQIPSPKNRPQKPRITRFGSRLV